MVGRGRPPLGVTGGPTCRFQKMLAYYMVVGYWPARPDPQTGILKRDHL
jgi:hypothetical protein